MASIQKFVAPGVYDPPGYSQAVKVTGAQTILYLAGQVAYDKDGGVAHRGDFKGQARAVRDEFFGPKGPASTMVEVSALAHPDYLIEVEAVAII